MLGGPPTRSGFPPPSGRVTPPRCGLFLLRRSQRVPILAPVLAPTAARRIPPVRSQLRYQAGDIARDPTHPEPLQFHRRLNQTFNEHESPLRYPGSAPAPKYLMRLMFFKRQPVSGCVHSWDEPDPCGSAPIHAPTPHDVDERDTIRRIKQAVATGQIPDTFKPADVNAALKIDWAGVFLPGSSHKCVHDSAQAGRPRRGKRLRMCSCRLTSAEVVCRSVDGRLRGPRFWWGTCSAAAGLTARY